ncbi:multiple sugar transport system substrate-binding protein [Paenibacillus turicensis]|uniref:Multiple sugar transport system substrate-binding protein n=1 Tax=Paenibacillus turicensis TaxID=160487 RepID=A0ABS4FN50_9BACL|nr:extracellular solute-binding protein [Paenibacillus turicensis]MBP1904012.1 multiple sugar transport system substrate-binding protein [Paenibacillus turicensis]
MKKWLSSMVLLSLVAVIMTSCTNQQGSNTSSTSKIKILYYDKEAFFEEYGNFLSIQYPNMEFEVISTKDIDYASESDSNVVYEKFIEKERPDIVTIQADQYQQLVHDGYLASLDQYIEKDKYNLDTVHPAITSLLRELGDGKLYGLSPKFYYQALFYNIDLFKQNGVEPPSNSMSWEQVLTLAKRFSSNNNSTDRVYGLGIDDLDTNNIAVNLADKIAFTQNLNDVNLKAKQVTANTEGWKNIWKLVLQATGSNVICDRASTLTMGSAEQLLEMKPFLTGKIAMTLDDSYLFEYIKQAKQNIKDFKELNYGIVTAPVDPANPDMTREIRLEEIFAIRNGSDHSDLAWDIIKLINSEDYAKAKSHSMNGSLLSRTGYYNDIKNIEAFYTLRPIAADYYKNEKYTDFYQQFDRVKKEEIGLVEAKKASIDDAVAAIQSKGQALLNQALKRTKD